MGAQVSSLERAGDAANDTEAFRRAWRDGMPFTLLHDEAFVLEKHQEISASKLVGGSQENDVSEVPLISGTNGVPMDELQQVADLARIKLFSKRRKPQVSNGAAQQMRTIASNAASGTSTSSDAAESDPAASVLAAATADKILSRESAESLARERLRKQRVEIIEFYFVQLAERLRAQDAQRDDDIDASTSFSTSAAVDARTTAKPLFSPSADLQPLSTPVNHLSTWSGSPSGVFTVASFRVQLEMLREFRVAMPRLFESSVLSIVQTLFDFPPFALQNTALSASEHALIADVHAFCQSILRVTSDNDSVLDSQRQVTLLLLLAFGVGCGRASLLLDFTESLVLGSKPTNASLLLRDRPFDAWIEALLARMESYRVDIALGAFEDGTLVKQFPVKLLQLSNDNGDGDKSNATTADKLPGTEAIATDGNFVYTWSVKTGLLKIGTGLNFTIAGRVYAESSSTMYTQSLQRQRVFHAALAGSGRDVTGVMENELRKRERGESLDSETTHIGEMLVTGDLYDIISSFTPRRLFVMYHVNDDDVVKTALLSDDDRFELPGVEMNSAPANATATTSNARVLAAFYGDFEVLRDVAMDRLRRRFEVASTSAGDNDDDAMVTVSLPLLGDLLAGTNKAGDVTDATELIVFYSTEGDDDDVVCSSFRVGDQISDVDDKPDDVYLSSMVLCGDSLYLSLLCTDSDRINELSPKPQPHQRPRRLVQISTQDLSIGSIYTLQRDASASMPAPTSKPLVTYVSEGVHIYEVEVRANALHVHVFAPSVSASGSMAIDCVQAFVIDIDSIQCTYVVSFFLLFLTHELGAADITSLPMLYTNGKCLAIVVPAAFDKSHCLIFDVETLAFVDDASRTQGASSSLPGMQPKCIETAIAGRYVCFDAKNNLLWALDSVKGCLAYYRNPGLRISMSQRVAPAQIIEQAVASSGDSRAPTRGTVCFDDVVKTRVLGFLSENAETSEPDEWPTLVGASLADPSTAVVPFVADLQRTGFDALLMLLKRFVAPFQANAVSVVDSYCLQASLSVLNAHVTLLLRVKRDANVMAALHMLRRDLSPLLSALIYASHATSVEHAEQLRDARSADAQSERVKLGVISKALDLYATCIRIFHPDVVQQFEGVITYLKTWKSGSISATELKIVGRLLGHLSNRTSDLQRAILASNETFMTFKHVVKYAVALQKQHLAAIFAQQASHVGDKNAPRLDDSDALVELTLLVNSVSQSVLLSLSDTSHETSTVERTLAVFSLFHLLCDGCNDVCAAAAAHIETTPPSRKTWTRAEHALRRGFFGVIASMLFSSALVLLHNREHVLAKTTTSTSIDSAEMKTALFEFLKENASKMTALLKAVETVGAMVEPSARQQTVDSVVVDAKYETMESAHEYENDKDEMRELRIAGATRLVVTFDAQSRTELNYDYVTFFKDQHKREYYGEQSYSGRDAEYNWPGVGANPPLVIESDHCFVAFHSDSSNTDWGYKFTARGEILKKKTSVKRHWLVFLAESIVHVLDESVSLFVDGSTFAPIADLEFQHERFLQSDLVKGGLCAELTQNTNVLELLRAIASASEHPRADKVVSALMHRSGTLRQQTASSSFTNTSEPSANQSVNTAVRAVAAAILHHNMWGMDAYAFAEGLRSDVSDQLLRGWKNAQKMRDWFHLGDAADASMQRPGSPSRRGSRKLRRQPSAFKGISEESLQILCDNVIERAQFLLDLTPASFSYVSSAKRRWGLLAKYGHAIGKIGSSESAIDKWYNLLDELQTATELRSLFQYRRNSSERMRSGQTKSVTEQVLEFIQSDVDVHELRSFIATRNLRAQSRAFGIDLFVRTWGCCSSVHVKAALAESFATTMNKMVQTYSSASGSPSPVLARVHFATKLSGCDESLRLRVSESYGRCLSEFASLLSAIALDSASCAVIVAVLKSCALDFDVEDSYLLHDSRILTHVLRLLSTDVIQIRRAAQSLLGVFLARFVVGKASASADASDQQDNNNDVVEATAFQRQLFAAVSFQLEGVAAQARAAAAAVLLDADDHSSDSHDLSLVGRGHAIHYLPDESPGLTAASLNHTQVSWNHSIMLWVFVHGESTIYALKVGDEVRRGPDWKGTNDDVCGDHDVGVVTAIVEPTRIEVRWGESAGEHVFDPKTGVFEVILVDQGVGGAIFVKGNKTMVKDTAFAAPWSSFGLYLNNQRQLSYKIARGSDRDCVYNSNYELEVNEWSHVAIVQERETLKLFVNGVMASHHLLDPFLLMHGHVNASEAKIVESVHPYPDAVDQYWPVHMPGASKIRVTFDPMCDIDQSTGFVRFYKNARCNEVWGDERYSGKYHDPERNFPGAQSGRHRGRRNSFAGASAVAPNSVEIPSDRFLVYFHNEGKSNGWGFRLLAAPEYPFDARSEPHGDALPAATRFPLNPYAFYFGESPCRVMDESAAKCSIYQPKVCDFAVDESELTSEIQASCPSAELEPTVVPRDRALHVLSLLRTCSETLFGRSLIATPENIGNLLAFALGDTISTVLRCASLANLRELVEFLSPDVAAAQLKRADPSVTGDLVEYVFAQISDYLDVWSAEAAADDDEATQRGSSTHHDADRDVGLLQLRKSAQEATSLVAAYISLLRSMAAHFDWSERIFECISEPLTAIQSFNAEENDIKQLGRAIASCAVLGGTYGGITVGGRVTCCVNIDGKETVETGYVLQLRLKKGVRSAQILFDCDRSRPIDVPVGDVAHLADEELDELAHFHASMAPFADRIKDLFSRVLALNVSSARNDQTVYKPKVTRKENVEVLESEHPYCSGEDVTYPLDFGDATEIVIYFDKQSCTAGPNDFVTFLKRSDANGSSTASRSREHWGDAKYFGGHFPGVGTTPPLRIPAASVDVHFHTDASASRDPIEWGFKLTAHAFEETLSLPPEIPPSLVASCLSDVRARCVKAIRSFVRLQKSSEVAPEFASLVPALTRIANEPSDGRPTCSTPRSQVFESKHPYSSSVREYMEVTFRGASKLTVTFDSQSRTELGCDYLSFFKDRSLTERWGASQYSGDDASANWPGFGGRPPLVIPSDSFTLFWYTDVSNVDWGWKFTVTAEFEPVPPLSLSLEQLDTRSYHLFEILYERPSPQRLPYPQEFEGYELIVDSDEREQHRWRNDPVHKCLAARGSAHELGLAALEKQQLYAVVDARGARVFSDLSQAQVVGALESGQRFHAVQHLDGWLELSLDEPMRGWVRQRNDDSLHVASVDGLCQHENLLVLGVDDVCLDAHHSVLEMNESNEEQDALASFFSQFAFESLKGQCNRFRGFAYDSHRAFATKCAREAILGLFSCSASTGAIHGRDFVDEHEFLLLLAHLLPRDAASRRADAETVELLTSTLTRLVDDPTNSSFIEQIVTRCLQLVHQAVELLPSGRGALRVIESEHPYDSNTDQSWQVSIAGAKRIVVTCDARSKCENGNAWLRFYKTGSDRSETFGESEYGGRDDNKNWPGCAGRPPLVIESNAFEAHFHSESSQNDWGFKLQAIGIFEDDDSCAVTDPKQQRVDTTSAMQVLNMCCWLLDVLSERTPESSNHELCQVFYSARVADAFVCALRDLPQQLKPRLLHVLTNLAQDPVQFHRLPHVLVEQLRALVDAKLSVQFTAEETSAVKSHFLQTLVQCAITVDLAIEGSRFCDSIHLSPPVMPAPQTMALVADASSSGLLFGWIGDAFRTARRHQYQVLLQNVTAPFTAVVWTRSQAASAKAHVAIEWDDHGNVSVLNASTNERVRLAQFATPLCVGDTATFQLDFDEQALVLRKNGLVTGVIASQSKDIDVAARWSDLSLSALESSQLAVGARSASASDNVLSWFVLASPLALLPARVVPSWYSKLVDSVTAMVAFHDSRAAGVAVRESSHPMKPSAKQSGDSETIKFPGAVALEVKLDRRTKLAKTDELQFRWTSKADDASESSSVRFVGVNGDEEQGKTPMLFLSESHKRNDLVRVGDLVLRSRDWEFGDEDGGIGSVGTVEEIVSWKGQTGTGVRVLWCVTGQTRVYRYGFNERFDVQRCARTSYRDLPFVIPGDSLSYSFQSSDVGGSETQASALAFAGEVHDFAGSLCLGTATLTLQSSPPEAPSVLTGDSTLEMWMHIAKSENCVPDRSESDTSVELVSLQSVDARTFLRVRASCMTGAISIAVVVLSDDGDDVAHKKVSVLENDLTDKSSSVAFDQWLHLAIVFAGSKMTLYQNGDLIFIAAWDPSAFACGTAVFGRRSQHVQVPTPCVHVYDVRLWNAALRTEQLKSHAKGLDTVSNVAMQLSSPALPVTPRSSKQQAMSPFLVPPSPPSSPSRSVAVPSHLTKWTTTNRTGKELVSVRLNTSIATRATAAERVIYYEAYPLASGKVLIGWMWTHAAPSSGEFVLGQSDDSFGIEPQQRLAHFRGTTSELEPFTAVERSAPSSPRRSSNRSGSSFSSEFWCRDGDVIGCALVLKTCELQFFINGQLVACTPLHDVAQDVLTSAGGRPFDHVRATEGDEAQSEFDQLVDELCSIGFSRRSSTEAVASSGGQSTADAVSWLLERDQNEVAASVAAEIAAMPRKHSARSRSSSSQSFGATSRESIPAGSTISPAATLGAQGAQGIVWNFGAGAFKFRPAELFGGDHVQVQSVIEATGCPEDQLHFEVFDHLEASWQRVAYRHKVQSIMPQMLGWWRLDDGTGAIVRDSSGNGNDGNLDCLDSKRHSSVDLATVWNPELLPPSAALRRNSDALAPPFRNVESIGETGERSRDPSSASRASLWGYRFYVIPHYSLDTIGHERLCEQRVRFGDDRQSAQLRHDKHLVKFVNQVAQARHMSVSQLLRATWGEIAPKPDELVRWPVLLEIATGVASEREHTNKSSVPASVDGVSHERLAKRFQVLQNFNAAVHRVLPYVNFRTLSTSSATMSSTLTQQQQLCDLVASQRHQIFNLVKRVVWDEALERTVQASVVLELTLNRPKAMRHRSTKKVDVDGRYALFSQAFRQLNSLSGAHYRRADNFYHVSFLGENAQDAGGPYRETLAQYCEELHSSQLPLLLPTSNSQHNVGIGREKWVLNPGASSATMLQMYEFLGKLMGVVLRSKQYLSLNIASMIWKLLVGEQLYIDDLAAVDSMIVNSMQKMRTIDTFGVTEEMFEDIVLEVFTTLSSDNYVVPLKPSGQTIAVTFANRCEYADLVEHYRFHEFDVQTAALFRGISTVVPAKLLACFTGLELELMVCGSPEIDVDLLERCTEYSSCSARDEHIVWFWQVLRGFSHDERSAFLRFVWGRSRLPANEKEFPQLFKLQSFNKAQAGRSMDAYLPIAHTCFFSVEMPTYSSEHVLRDKLLYAIYNCQEIDGDGDSVAANQLGWEE